MICFFCLLYGLVNRYGLLKGGDCDQICENVETLLLHTDEVPCEGLGIPTIGPGPPGPCVGILLSESPASKHHNYVFYSNTMTEVRVILTLHSIGRLGLMYNSKGLCPLILTFYNHLGHFHDCCQEIRKKVFLGHGNRGC